MSRDSYWRRFQVVRVVDGDTIVARIDLGFHLSTEQMVRLLWVDTPETNAKDPALRAAAAAAKKFTAVWFAEHTHRVTGEPWFYGRTEKDDAFGRWLMQVECEDLHSLQDDLLANGHAVPFKR